MCYIHLGSAFYQTYHLWGLIFLLRNEVTRDRRGYFHPSIRTKLKDYLENINQNSLCKKIERARTLAEKHIDETRQYLSRINAQMGLTVADRYTIQSQKTPYLKDRALDLYKQLRLKMNEKGYLKWAGIVGRNPNPKHISQELGENRNE